MQHLIDFAKNNWEGFISGPIIPGLMFFGFFLLIRFSNFWTSPSDERKLKGNP